MLDFQNSFIICRRIKDRQYNERFCLHEENEITAMSIGELETPSSTLASD